MQFEKGSGVMAIVGWILLLGGIVGITLYVPWLWWLAAIYGGLFFIGAFTED
jgi:hypothetical protein